MLKFIKGHMASIDGIEIFPVISFLIFFTMFVIVLMWVFKMTKSEVDELSSIPLSSRDNEYENDNI
ncbi:MAG: CcoQ/FixQ family Cbb3-type cytochrome c oxidase assembly chaperone [Salibacteraceae bacterium]